MKKRWEKIFYGPGRWTCRILPAHWKAIYEHRLGRYYKQVYPESNTAIGAKVEEFLVRQLSGIFWGLLACIFLLIGLVCYQQIHVEEVFLKRNPYGIGKRQEELILQKGEEEKTISLDINEALLSEEELEELFSSCMKAVKDGMAGENSSLNHVNRPLNFPDSIGGYPFDITYHCENAELLTSFGNLGEKGILRKKGLRKKTSVTICLSYNGLERKETVGITIVPPDEIEQDSSFHSVQDMLKRLEAATRRKETVHVPNEYEGVSIRPKNQDHTGYGALLLLVFLTIFLTMHQYQSIKELAIKARISTTRDYPDIVHYITIYMGAGLSFSSAVSRISDDYQKGAYGHGRRYAYDQIVLMDRQMKMGTSQKEACLKWGNQFHNNMYQKLALLLVQSFSKGSKEANVLLEQARKDAFRQYIDQTRKQGEEASSKLLLPMMVLMMIVMCVILLPALVQFGLF